MKKASLVCLLWIYFTIINVFAQNNSIYLELENIRMDISKKHTYLENVNGKSFIAALTEERTLAMIELSNEAKDTSLIVECDAMSFSSVAYSKGKQHLATIGEDAKIKVWNTSLELVAEVQIPKSGMNSGIALGNQSTYLAYTYTDDNQGYVVSMYDYQSGKNVKVLSGNDFAVRQIYFSPNDQYLVSASDFDVVIWEVATGNTIKIISVEYPEKLTFTHDNSVIAFTSDGDRNLCVYDIFRGEIKKVALSVTGIEDLQFDMNKILYAAGHKEGDWYAWAYYSLDKLPLSIDFDAPMIIMQAFFSNDGKKLMITNGAYKLGIVDLKW
ncbi:MAG: hypothetical protein EAZ55_02005 [Cytophagales bacterium]|nr:MAG: hypothetical protein EAZ55_02005 [Cytophagales bacterium]